MSTAPSERTIPLPNDTAETLPAMAPMVVAAEPLASSRNRVLMLFGVVFFLVAATLVVVAQNATRRHEAPILIQAGN